MANKPNINPENIGAGLGELKSRLLFLLFAIFVYRIGTHIPVPGIDPLQLQAFFNQNEGTFADLFNMFSGGALERMSIVALGIMPYISASIIMQLLTAVSPQLDQLKKEGESGRRKITQYTRYGALVLATVGCLGTPRSGDILSWPHRSFSRRAIRAHSVLHILLLQQQVWRLPAGQKAMFFCRQQRTTRARDSFWDPDIEGSIFFI